MNRELVREGKRLVVAPMEVRHLSASVEAWFSQTDHLKYYSSTRREVGMDHLRDLILSTQADSSLFLLGIFTKSDPDPIGTVKIGPIHAQNQTSDLVVHIGDPSQAGKGYASEAICLANHIAFEDLGIRKLEGGMYADNVSAVRAYLKTGWFIEGTLRAHYVVEGQPMDRVMVGCFPETAKPLDSN